MFSIRNVLISTFLIISLALSCLVMKSLYDSNSQRMVFDQVARRTLLDKTLFNILLNYRQERGQSATALQMSADKGKSSLDGMALYRGKVDAASADLAAGVDAVSDAELTPFLAQIKSGYQTKLEAHGYDVGKIDGILGSGTRIAIQKEQQRLGQPADGWATEALLNAL